MMLQPDIRTGVLDDDMTGPWGPWGPWHPRPAQLQHEQPIKLRWDLVKMLCQETRGST